MRLWNAIAEGQTRDAALDVVSHIAEHLRDPLRVTEITQRISDQSSLPTRGPMPMPYLLRRQVGIGLLFGQLHQCFPNRGWDGVAHQYLALAAQSLEDPSFPLESPGLFGGLAGICFAAQYLSQGGARYHRLRTTLDVLLADQVHTLGSASLVIDGVGPGDYDLISGVTGIGAYLLAHTDTDTRASALDLVLNRLLFLSTFHEGQLRFSISPHKQPTDRHREQFPDGYTDCGMAHGVPGPLSLLALVALHNGASADLYGAIRRLADWIINYQTRDAWGITWPYTILPDGTSDGDGSSYRNAWCYGSAGVARALWLAGRALSDPNLQLLACETLRAVQARPVAGRGIPSPILCHGVAGLLQIAMRFANETGDEGFRVMACDLTDQLLELFDPHSAFGFRDLEPDGRQIDSPSLLDGATGIALALLAAATDIEPSWDRMLLLS